MTRLAPFVLLAALTACDKPSAPTPPAAAPAPAASGAVNPRVTVTTYDCPGGQTLTAAYPDRDTAVVTWKNHTYSLKIARSASGARYTGYGLQWWTGGLGRGTISTLKPGEELASDPGLECVAPDPNPVSPPTPGTPGGLPDDRTPISETPFKPTSAQGAANVLQTYFALVESGKSAEGAKLRVDGELFDATPYDTYHAEIGAPGPIEGAAGSLYVEVPVVVYGRLASGKEFRQSGRAILRRVNNVPGATEEQLRWRIAWFDLK
jgi:membrane-bound inhibitor of C-type lysozyme